MAGPVSRLPGRQTVFYEFRKTVVADPPVRPRQATGPGTLETFAPHGYINGSICWVLGVPDPAEAHAKRPGDLTDATAIVQANQV